MIPHKQCSNSWFFFPLIFVNRSTPGLLLNRMTSHALFNMARNKENCSLLAFSSKSVATLIWLLSLDSEPIRFSCAIRKSYILCCQYDFTATYRPAIEPNTKARFAKFVAFLWSESLCTVRSDSDREKLSKTPTEARKTTLSPAKNPIMHTSLSAEPSVFQNGDLDSGSVWREPSLFACRICHMSKDRGHIFLSLSISVRLLPSRKAFRLRDRFALNVLKRLASLVNPAWLQQKTSRRAAYWKIFVMLSRPSNTVDTAAHDWSVYGLALLLKPGDSDTIGSLMGGSCVELQVEAWSSPSSLMSWPVAATSIGLMPDLDVAVVSEGDMAERRQSRNDGQGSGRENLCARGQRNK